MVDWPWLIVVVLLASGVGAVVCVVALFRWRSRAVRDGGFFHAGQYYTVECEGALKRSGDQEKDMRAFEGFGPDDWRNKTL